MANADFTASLPVESSARKVQHPFVKAWSTELPPPGRIKWLGGNLAMDFPIEEYAIDSEGKYAAMTLQEVLNRLDDFIGYRCGTPIKQNLIECAFDAYEYGLMTDDERLAFEQYVRNNLSAVSSLEKARKVLRCSNG